MKKLLLSLLRIITTVAVTAILTMVAVFYYLRQPSWKVDKCASPVRADARSLEKTVRELSELNPARCVDEPEGLENAARLIEEKLRQHCQDVELQLYSARKENFRNIIAHFGGDDPEGKIIVGAHYDVYERKPGADDNASAVAGLIELTRMLSLDSPKTPIDLVAFSTEEPPFFGTDSMGSAVHARSLIEKGAKVKGVVVLEMIGYFTGEQGMPHPVLRLMYPSKGDFILVTGRTHDRELIDRVKASMKAAEGVKTFSIASPLEAGIDDSDHRNYWKEGFTAVMITDTAYHRNPNYHSLKDTGETLDYEKMAGVVNGVFFFLKNN